MGSRNATNIKEIQEMQYELFTVSWASPTSAGMVFDAIAQVGGQISERTQGSESFASNVKALP